MSSPALTILPGIIGFRSSTDSCGKVRAKVIRLSENTQTLVALALVAPNNRLLVVQEPHGELDLPGLEIGDPTTSTNRLTQLVSRLGLDQTQGQMLYLSSLRMRKQQATPVVGVIRVVRLAKAQHFDIPGSRYETISSLVEDESATAVTRAVARWLQQAQG